MPRLGPVLLVYWNPYGAQLRATVSGHLNAIASAVASEHVVRFNAIGGMPASLRRLRPSAVILHTTFLGIRWIKPFEAWRQRGRWLADLDVPKLAFPQDDYDHADVLDEWLAELGVSSIFSPMADSAELYVRSRASAKLFAVLTGYVDDSLAHTFSGGGKPWLDRPHDVVYRATSLPYWFGSQGQLKRVVGEAAQVVAGRHGWSSDVSLSEVISGTAWFRHLESGRAVVGCESGSSVLDRRGEVRARIRRILAADPHASFADVSSQMPAGWDSHSFTALSPRHLEAAMTRTAQVLVKGSYSGVLREGQHYLPVASDLSDLADAIGAALDPAVGRDLVDCAWTDLVESGKYSYRRLTEAVQLALPDDVGTASRWSRLGLEPRKTAARARGWLAQQRPARRID